MTSVKRYQIEPTMALNPCLDSQSNSQRESITCVVDSEPSDSKKSKGQLLIESLCCDEDSDDKTTSPHIFTAPLESSDPAVEEILSLTLNPFSNLPDTRMGEVVALADEIDAYLHGPDMPDAAILLLTLYPISKLELACKYATRSRAGVEQSLPDEPPPVPDVHPQLPELDCSITRAKRSEESKKGRNLHSLKQAALRDGLSNIIHEHSPYPPDAARASWLFQTFRSVVDEALLSDPFIARWKFRAERYEALRKPAYDYVFHITPAYPVGSSVLVEEFNQLMFRTNRRLFGPNWWDHGLYLQGFIAAEQKSDSESFGLHFQGAVISPLPSKKLPERKKHSPESVLAIMLDEAKRAANKSGRRQLFTATSIRVEPMRSTDELVSYLTKELTERDGAVADLLYELGPKGINWLGIPTFGGHKSNNQQEIGVRDTGRKNGRCICSKDGPCAATGNSHCERIQLPYQQQNRGKRRSVSCPVRYSLNSLPKRKKTRRFRNE